MMAMFVGRLGPLTVVLALTARARCRTVTRSKRCGSGRRSDGGAGDRRRHGPFWRGLSTLSATKRAVDGAEEIVNEIAPDVTHAITSRRERRELPPRAGRRQLRYRRWR
jgi:hypothetical protein